MKHLFLLSFLLCPFLAFSQANSIVGDWKTIDDKTGEAKSVVRIYKDTNGKYYGKIEELFQNQEGKCVNCKDENKDKPILGLVILTDMKENGDKLDGGYILDPASGDKYNATISLEKDGRLKMRGSLGKVGLLGRNQYWVRVK
jgi:uncharacterized protein (DUF2147 family)